MRRFRDRTDAGRQLGAAVRPLQLDHPVVLGIPRGGVPVAVEVALALGGDLGLVVARKLRAPHQPELAIGAVTADGVAFVNEDLARDVGAGEHYLASERAHQTEEARRREAMFDGHLRPPVRGRPVVIVDDGVATGATAIAAARSMRASGASEVILAFPVGAADSIQKLRAEADQVICPRPEQDFWAVGEFYEDFRAVEDSEVMKILEGWRTSRSTRTSEDLEIPKGVQSLSARLLVPAGSGPFPCVVFVHGLGSSKDSPRNVVIAEQLTDAGMAALLFDLNGHGDSDPDPRGSELPAFVDDVAAAMDWLARQPAIDPARLAVAGSSLGAVVALRAVRERRANPCAIVLRAPPAERSDFAGLGTPSLVVIGSEDPLFRDVRSAVSGVEAVTLAVVPGAGHLFEEPGALEEATKHTVTWLQAKLNPMPVSLP